MVEICASKLKASFIGTVKMERIPEPVLIWISEGLHWKVRENLWRLYVKFRVNDQIKVDQRTTKQLGSKVD